MQEDNERNFFISIGDDTLKSTNGKDLHLFVPDPENLNKSLDHFSDLFAMRTRKSQEYWLLDGTNIKESLKDLFEIRVKDLPNLDLDDDLYFVERNKPSAKSNVPS